MTVTACLVIIGNEILSGRTQDRNLAHIAAELNEVGVRLVEARVIPDIEDTIVATVNEVRGKFDYVFTTGGIGPTHDDITAAAIAKAFGVKLVRDKAAEKLLTDLYRGTDKLNEARLKMADVPEGSELIPNPVSTAPGFRVGNVYVMAGVPAIMQAMLKAVLPTLKGARKLPVRAGGDRRARRHARRGPKRHPAALPGRRDRLLPAFRARRALDHPRLPLGGCRAQPRRARRGRSAHRHARRAHFTRRVAPLCNSFAGCYSLPVLAWRNW
ncbi:MAG: competence/damage-inducible protein A [Alphaproteobacteria bacterium]